MSSKDKDERPSRVKGWIFFLTFAFVMVVANQCDDTDPHLHHHHQPTHHITQTPEQQAPTTNI